MKRSHAGLCLALFSFACGRPEAGLHVSVGGALAPSQDYDALTIEARLEANGEAIATESFNGDSLRALPVSVNFLAGPTTPVGTTLHVVAKAMKEDVLIATGVAKADVGEADGARLELQLMREGETKTPSQPATPDPLKPTDPPTPPTAPTPPSNPNPPTIPPTPTGSAVCAMGFADCDNDSANGCEKQLNATPPSCDKADLLGNIVGDGGALKTDVVTGTGQKILRLETFEDSVLNRDVSALIKLESPPGSDYDLIVQGAACTGNTSATKGGPGGTEQLQVCQCDVIAIDNNVTYYVIVKYRSGTTCGQWKLWAEGNSAGGACGSDCS